MEFDKPVVVRDVAVGHTSHAVSNFALVFETFFSSQVGFSDHISEAWSGLLLRTIEVGLLRLFGTVGP